VNVIAGIVGEIVVHYELNAGNVDAASGDVGSDEDTVLARAETLEGSSALRERAVGVNLGSVVTGGIQSASDLAGTVFRAREDEDWALHLLEQML
jgi:hypothetical protein